MGPSSTNIRLFRKLLSKAKIAATSDPWDLPSVFFVIGDNNLKTVSGFWKRIVAEWTGILSGLLYVGIRETFEFYLHDGTKTDWVLHEYKSLSGERHDDLVIKDEVRICKVFKKVRTHETSPRSFQYNSADILLWNGTFLPQRFSTYHNQEPLQRLYGFQPEPFVNKESHDAADVWTVERCNQLQDKVDSLPEWAKQDPTVHCDTHAKSEDDVWQRFTKIHTNDPDVVYAACHHCDQVLKAHPKKHGTSQLKRHMSSAKCRSSCSNPSTDEDREMLRCLRVELDLYEQQRVEGSLQCEEINTNLTQLNPCVLSHNHSACYVYATTSLNRQTNEGCWEEIDKELTAIPTEQQPIQDFWLEMCKEIDTAIQNDYPMQVQVPQYMGLRRTLEFHLNHNGNKLKTGWIMLEYQQADYIKSPALFLQGAMVIRKVFHYDKDEVAAIFSDFDRRLDGDNNSEEHYNGEGVNMDSTLTSDYMNGRGDRKRKRVSASKRTSEVWMYFTKIRTADDNVVYAVCHHCDRGYSSGRSTNGTSHLWRHKKSCTSKLPGTGSVNNGANAAWEAEIWPLFLLYKNYGATELQASGI